MVERCRLTGNHVGVKEGLPALIKKIMTEAENTGVEDQVIDSQAVAEPEAEADVQAKAESQKEDVNASNWRETRQLLKEQQRMIRELQAQQQPPRQESEPDIYREMGISEEDLATGKHVAGLMKEINSLKKALNKNEPQDVEEKMRLRYSDFDEVLSQDNIEYLLKTEPKLVNSIRSIKDPTLQAETAYLWTKKLMPKEDAEAQENKRKIEENRKKPLSSSIVAKAAPALDQAHSYTQDKVLTKEGRDFYYSQMQTARKQAR